MEQHNLAEGEENPIDLRIARAQAGATNLIWIMRKAKLHKKLRDVTRCGSRRRYSVDPTLSYTGHVLCVTWCSPFLE